MSFINKKCLQTCFLEPYSYNFGSLLNAHVRTCDFKACEFCAMTSHFRHYSQLSPVCPWVFENPLILKSHKMAILCLICLLSDGSLTDEC